jgi:hypothetical protein
MKSVEIAHSRRRSTFELQCNTAAFILLDRSMSALATQKGSAARAGRRVLKGEITSAGFVGESRSNNGQVSTGSVQ